MIIRRNSFEIIKCKPKGEIMETLLKELSLKININLSEDEISKFVLYKNLLKEWNEIHF